MVRAGSTILRTVRIDLHAHSRASDGTQTPAELVRAAAAAGLDVLAITDHDTADGWDEAAAAALEAGIDLVRGMEISTRFDGRGAHLLAYLPDPTFPALVTELDQILAGRNARLPAMVTRLRELGVEIEADDVRRLAGSAATGRPHVADTLVSMGVVGDRDEAFARFLNPGRPAYADRHAASLTDMIRTITSAGGVTVLAHPWGRHRHEEPDEAALAGLAEVGLAGLEVDHQDHDAGARERLRAIATNLELVITGSSDHHGTGKTDHELGCNTTAPEHYHRLLELASAAAARSGREVPAVVTR